MKTLLWLDDIRDPNIWGHRYFPEYFDLNTFFESEVIWLKSYDEFVKWIEEMGVPNHVGFDHDLGTEKSGYDAAKFLCEYCVENSTPLPEFDVQSDNPIGIKDIPAIMASTERYMRVNNV